MSCKPRKYYLTLPNGVPPYNNQFGYIQEAVQSSPNEVFFTDRHTYSLSTPDYEGDLPWFIVLSHVGFMGQPFTGSDSILTERAVFQRDRTVVMLKPDAILMQLNVRLQGYDGCELSDILTRQLAYMLSWDHATATPCNANTRDIAFPYDQPNDWTLSYEVCIGGESLLFHRDITILWVDTDDAGAGSGGSLTTTVSMYSAGSTWYLAEELVYTGEQTQANLGPRSFDRLPIDPSLSFIYTGTARGGLGFEFRTGGRCHLSDCHPFHRYCR